MKKTRYSKCNMECLNCVYKKCVNPNGQITKEEYELSKELDSEFTLYPDCDRVKEVRSIALTSYHKHKHEHIEQRAKYRENNRESIRESNRIYYQNNKEKIAERWKVSYYENHEENKEKNRVRMKNYRDSHREEVNRKQREYRARKKLLESQKSV